MGPTGQWCIISDVPTARATWRAGELVEIRRLPPFLPSPRRVRVKERKERGQREGGRAGARQRRRPVPSRPPAPPLPPPPNAPRPRAARGRREVVRGDFLECGWREAGAGVVSTRNRGIEGELARDASRTFQNGGESSLSLSRPLIFFSVLFPSVYCEEIYVSFSV